MDLPGTDNSLPLNQPQSETGVRRLAAIMFTDIKDFSRRMQKDEDATMRMLRVHNTMMNATVTKYSGHVIKTVGDAFLVSFNSVVSATQCAIEVQQNFNEYNHQFKSDDDKIMVRIGIHLGDIIETADKDIFGDGVNIASRIQSIAEVGGLNISESVYQQVKNKLNIRVINLGVPQLKGISEPIKIYQVIVVPSDKARGKIATNVYVARTILKRKKTKRILAAAAIVILLGIAGGYFFLRSQAPSNTLAILPFKNIGDPETEYLADGISEDLTTYLSRSADMRIISSGTTSYYKNTKMSEADIATQLGVRFLVTGSLERTGNNKFIIRVRMVEPSENRDTWGDKYYPELPEIPETVHEILREVTSRLGAEIDSKYDRDVPVAARDDYYQGLKFDRKQRKEDNQQAISYLQSAVEKYPAYVDARLKLANCEITNTEFSYDLSEKWLVEAEQHIMTVYAIDSLNPELYAVWGRLLLAKGQRKQGIEYLERCIRMNPNYSRAYVYLGSEYLQNQNNPEKAIEYFKIAKELEPANFITSVALAVGYAVMQNYDEAIKEFRRATTINPTHAVPWENLTYLYTLTGQIDSAENASRNALSIDPKNVKAATHYVTLLLKHDQFLTADSVMTAMLQYNPQDYSVLYALGFIKMASGKVDSARVTWGRGLKFAEDGVRENPTVAEHSMYAGLFSSRVGDAEKAIYFGTSAFARDSSEESAIGLAKIYANLGDRQKMFEWFSRARSMNPEYDQTYIENEFDFQRYMNDQELLAVAKK